MKMKNKNNTVLTFILLLVIFATNYCYGQEIKRDGNIYTLSAGDLIFSISAQTGGRIVSFRRGNSELLTSTNEHPRYYGATFWISPQKDYWPPYPAIDQLPYKTTIIGHKIQMVSQTENMNFRITKEFSISTSNTAICIAYKIENISNKTYKLAPWDVTRVFGGLSFFPIGEEDKNINISSIPNSFIKSNILWVPFIQEKNMKAQKLFNTAKGGWMAHYYKNLLFVKCFPDIQVEDIPPQQGEVEIFIAANGKYIELENHGRYITLAPNESTVYNEKYYLLFLGQNKKEKDLLSIIKQLNKKVN